MYQSRRKTMLREKGRETLRGSDGKGDGGDWKGEGEWLMVKSKSRKPKVELTTFYFSHFPNAFGKKDLWKVFNRWGHVNEVFIIPKRSKKGWRYGFVRFWGVNDIVRLERHLHCILIGNMKMQVNAPKFNRRTEEQGPQHL